MATIYKKGLGRGLSRLLEECNTTGIREFEITEAESIYKNSNNLRPLIVRCFELEDEYNSIKHKNHDVTLPVGFGVSILLYDKYSPDLYNFKCKWYEDKISKIKESIKKIQEQEKLQKQKEIEQQKTFEISNRKKYISKPQKTYLIKDNNTGFYKIGKSINPKVREKTLQAEKPTYTRVKVWDKNIESELHKKYKDQRVRGEWFKLTHIQVKYICTHY